MRTERQPWSALRTARRTREITGTDLAKRAGIARSSLGALEAGRRQPSMAMYARLADALGMATFADLDPGEAREQLAPPPAVAALTVMRSPGSGVTMVDRSA